MTDLHSTIERQLTDSPLTAREIWGRVDCYALQTVRRALGDLADEGRAVRDVEPFNDQVRFKYRKPCDVSRETSQR